MKTQNYMGLTVHYREGTSDEAVLSHSFSNDIFFPAIPELKVCSNVIIDIGAHIGTFSLLSSIRYKYAKVYAFEPNAESFKILEENVAANGLHNIKCLNMAVTKQTGMTELYLDTDNWGHSTCFKCSEASVNVNAINLSDFFEREHIKDCDLIKFNCEGAEFEILLSLKYKQLSSIGMMLVLFHEDLSQESIDKLYKYLTHNGFRCRVVNRTPNRGWLIAKNRSVYSNNIPATTTEVKILLKEFRTWLQLS